MKSRVEASSEQFANVARVVNRIGSSVQAGVQGLPFRGRAIESTEGGRTSSHATGLGLPARPQVGWRMI